MQIAVNVFSHDLIDAMLLDSVTIAGSVFQKVGTARLKA